MRTTITILLLGTSVAWAQAPDDEVPPPLGGTPPPAPAPAPAPAPTPAPAPVAVVAVAPAPEPVAAVWTMGVAPRLGVTKPTSKLGAMVVGGLEVDFATPVANHQLIVAIDFSLTQPSYSASATSTQIPGGMTTYDIHQTEVVLGLVGDYRFAAADKSFVPHVGAGPVIHMLKTNETESVAPGENTAQQTKLGFELEGGLDIKAGPGLVAGDVRVIYSGLDTPLTGSSNAGNIELAVGYRLVF